MLKLTCILRVPVNARTLKSLSLLQMTGNCLAACDGLLLVLIIAWIHNKAMPYDSISHMPNYVVAHHTVARLDRNYSVGEGIDQILMLFSNV